MTAIWPVITGRQKSESLKNPLDSITDYFYGSFLSHHRQDSLGRKLSHINSKTKERDHKNIRSQSERCQKRTMSNKDGLKYGRFQKLAVFEVDGL